MGCPTQGSLGGRRVEEGRGVIWETGGESAIHGLPGMWGSSLVGLGCVFRICFSNSALGGF